MKKHRLLSVFGVLAGVAASLVVPSNSLIAATAPVTLFEQFPPAGSIAGTVTSGGGPIFPPVQVIACLTSTQSQCGFAQTGPQGSYQVNFLVPGAYDVWFLPAPPLAGEYYDNALDQVSATPVEVAGGSVTSGINADLSIGGTISGIVTSRGGPVESISVSACKPASVQCRFGYSAIDGTYVIQGLTPGDYLVQFAPSSQYCPEFFDNSLSESSATLVSVNAGVVSLGVHADLALDRGGCDAWPDFDGDGRADRSVLRPEVGGWFVDGAATSYLGLLYDNPVPGDYDGDGTTERAVFRDGAWFIEGLATRYLGATRDAPVPGDYDGDGDWEPAVYRDGAWFTEGGPTTYLGAYGDIPVPADYNGDGIIDRAVYRRSVGGWYIEGRAPVFFGLSSDIPVPADYDGDGDADIAVYRPAFGGWYVNGAPTEFVGLSSDVPVPADYNGDGTADRAIYRPEVGGWYVQGQPTVFYGLSSDIPLPLPTAIHESVFGCGFGTPPSTPPGGLPATC